MLKSRNFTRTIIVLMAVVLLVLVAFRTLGAMYKNDIYQAALTIEESKAALVKKQIRVDGTQIAYLDNGQTDLPVLVAVHGFGAQKENWLRFAAAIKDRFHVIAMDLPGHGESEKSFQADYTIPGQVLFLRQFIDQLGLEKVHLAGNSMGGAITALYAATYPQKVSSLVLFDSAGVFDFKAPFQEALERGDNPLIVHSVEGFDQLIQLALEQPPFIPWPISEVAAEKAMANAQINQYIFEQSIKLPADRFKDQLAAIESPTLILWGAEDRVLNVRNADVFEKQIAGSKKIIYQGVGHAPMIEIPVQSANDVMAFLADVK